MISCPFSLSSPPCGLLASRTSGAGKAGCHAAEAPNIISAATAAAAAAAPCQLVLPTVVRAVEAADAGDVALAMPAGPPRLCLAFALLEGGVLACCCWLAAWSAAERSSCASWSHRRRIWVRQPVEGENMSSQQ
eukprot:1159797-Pelagomonas_calceolata.AAC.6